MLRQFLHYFLAEALAKLCLSAIVTIVVASTSLALEPVSTQYRPAVHYQRLNLPVQQPDSEKVLVQEFFSYACVHCYNADSQIERWQKQSPEIIFSRVPVIFNKAFSIYANAYYTAEALSVLNIAHMPIFSAIHKQRRLPPREKELARFFTSFGIDEEVFIQTFNSMGVHVKVRQAEGMSRVFRISSVPAMVVAGSFRVVLNENVPDIETLLKVSEFLVAKELAGKATKATTDNVNQLKQ